MSTIIEDIEAWFKDRPLWLQDATRRLVEQGEIKDSDIHELTLLCLKEAGLNIKGEEAPEPHGIPEGSLIKNESSNQVHLLSISNPVGINALNPRNPLEFGDSKLAVVYGRNSAGKSGYARILKHACGARCPGPLYQNISSDTQEEQKCKLNYLINSKPQEINWLVSDGIIENLSVIEAYDSACADVYINEENEISYEPGILALFRYLTDICDKIKNNIGQEIISKTSTLPQIPSSLALTNSGKWVSRLNRNISKEEIDKACTWDEDAEKECEDVAKRLKEPDPKAKAISLHRTKTNVDNLTKILNALSDALSQSSCEDYVEAKNNAITKRKAATVDAQKVFEDAPLDGVGSATWKQLWEQARKYSETKVYKEIVFPNIAEDSRCVLCHQPLDEESKKRFEVFESFVKGGLEKDAADAEKLLLDLKEKIEDMPTEEDIDLLLDSGGIEKEEQREKFQDLRKELEKRQKNLLITDDAKEFLDIKGIENIAILEEMSISLDRQAAVYEKDANEDNRTELESQVLEYKAKKWLYTQKEKIVAEVDRLSIINKLAEARKLTRTRLLSDMKSDLADVLITTEYINRFNQEVKTLGAKYIGVQLIKTRTEKGRALHQIVLPNNKLGIPTSEILSEGELRIVSLAAFLADVEGRANKSTFIFDDPITSLDQEYEEAAVSRLVELSKSRQVIVFTHRLSMLSMLEDIADKNEIEINVIGLQRETWGAGEPREAPLPAQKPKKAINTLIDQVARARKIQNEVGQAEYELIAKGICSELRITLERLIENDLLADVVHRFRREIHTKNKLSKLSKIAPEDCKYIDDLMTEYSKYEHSQSKEISVSPPDPDKLEADLKALKDWRDEFEKRVI